MPQKLLDVWKQLSREPNTDAAAALRQRIELYLDQGYGECHLKDPRIANSTQQSFLFFDGERYRLAAWVVMPNHAHLLLTRYAGHSLIQRLAFAKILHS